MGFGHGHSSGTHSRGVHHNYHSGYGRKNNYASGNFVLILVGLFFLLFSGILIYDYDRTEITAQVISVETLHDYSPDASAETYYRYEITYEYNATTYIINWDDDVYTDSSSFSIYIKRNNPLNFEVLPPSIVLPIIFPTASILMLIFGIRGIIKMRTKKDNLVSINSGEINNNDFGLFDDVNEFMYSRNKEDKVE